MAEFTHAPDACCFEGLCLSIFNKASGYGAFQNLLTGAAVIVVLVVSGTIEIEAGTACYSLRSQNILLLPRATPAKVLHTDDHPEFYTLEIKPGFLFQNKPAAAPRYLSLVVRRSPLCIKASAADYLNFKSIFNLLHTKITSTLRQPFAKELICHYFNTLSLELAALSHDAVRENRHRTMRKENLTLHFLSLLPVHCKEWHSVIFYARLSCVTPDYLNRVVKEVTRYTVKQHIAGALTAEAKVLLETTEMTIQEIAEELTFANSSFFSNFFKKYVHLSPTAYRQGRRDSLLESIL